MTFQEAKKISNQLNLLVDDNSNKLNEFLIPYKNQIIGGLVPNNIRNMKEFQELKHNYDISFKQLQAFNKYYIKEFKKELQEERDKKRKKRVIKNTTKK